MRKYCLNCGKKFYPNNSWTGYPQTEYDWRTRLEVPAEHKHFHSLSCMKKWLAKNKLCIQTQPLQKIHLHFRDDS